MSFNIFRYYCSAVALSKLLDNMEKEAVYRDFATYDRFAIAAMSD